VRESWKQPRIVKDSKKERMEDIFTRRKYYTVWKHAAGRGDRGLNETREVALKLRIWGLADPTKLSKNFWAFQKDHPLAENSEKKRVAARILL